MLICGTSLLALKRYSYTHFSTIALYSQNATNETTQINVLYSSNTMTEIAISLKNISKCFKRYGHPVERLKEVLLPGASRADEFWAVQNINLEIPKGETIGLVGRNGSGKSTLLQIIAGTLTPTTGKVRVNGRVSALLELGSGFNPEFTGRQNVAFNGQLLGLSKKEIDEKFNEIVDFANIGDFIDQPVKTYSSGMFVRLAFAVVVNVNPEILIIDEALSVGDGVFVHRCMAKIKEFQDAGGTILFVSHDMGSINRLCSSCIWINSGRVIEQGSSVDISKSYQAWMYGEINKRSRKVSENLSKVQQIDISLLDNLEADIRFRSDRKVKHSNENPFTGREYRSFQNVKRFGTGRCEILSVELLNLEGQKVGFVMPNETLTILTKIITYDQIEDPVFGITMFDRLRVCITGWNTTQYEYRLPRLEKNKIVCMRFEMIWPQLKSDTYALEPAIADGSQDNHEMVDWLQAPVTINSGVTDLTFGLIKFNDVIVSHTVEEFTNSQSSGNLLLK